YGLTTMLQLASVYDGKFMLPQITISDKPDCKYRGLLVDTARSFHPVSELKNYIDLCWLLKIKYLHIHFSDDDSYTLPSKAFPLLSTEGRSYTFDEIAELDSYAADRNIQIVPEVDTPGHATAIMKAYPEIFGKEGILCFHEEAIEGTKAIYREICEMFPNSEMIHIGGDEGRLGWWLGCDKCAEYGKQMGYNMEDEAPGMSQPEWVMLRYLAHYIAENANQVLEMGKTPIVWEGFHKATNDMIPKGVKVMVWDSSFQLSSSLVASGFEVINCSWIPTYVVTPLWLYSKKQCYDWDITSFGTINDASPYQNGMMKMESGNNIIGGQLNSWGDFVEKADYYEHGSIGRYDGLMKVTERLPFIAENTWNVDKRNDYNSVCAAAEHIAELFDKMINYR
ncbi:MAG: family 20 glycosylhydrolase, partial [Clostridia bacterium]|nr:family 20 glycosylhydrolase [Clostridia bacterium]